MSCSRPNSWLIFLSMLAVISAHGSPCPPEKQTLYFQADSSADQMLYRGFAGRLADSLATPLRRIGYCLSEDLDQIRAVDSGPSRLIMYVAAKQTTPTADSGVSGLPAVIVALIRADQFSPANLQKALAHPLVSVEYYPESPETYLGILIRKIVENLRTGFVSYLVVESNPPGALIETQSGLEGRSPVEWIFPLSRVHVLAHKEGYLEFSKEVDLASPGNHRLHIQLTKERFYHSKLMIPTAIFLAAAAGSFAAEWYYYQEYKSLTEKDYFANPGAFARTFEQAKLMERAGFASLGAAGVCFLLSFVF